MPADKRLAALLAELIAVLCRYRELVTGDETADHIVTYDQPEEFGDRVCEFLAEALSGSSHRLRRGLRSPGGRNPRRKRLSPDADTSIPALIATVAGIQLVAVTLAAAFLRRRPSVKTAR